MSKHIARKRFGQNFLIDQQVIADIVNAVAPKRDDCVVEIGPGLAALTAPLLQRLDHLHVVEIDRDIIARLKKQYSSDKLTIHEGDALEFDFGTLASSGRQLHIVGNLPYNISTPLLFHLASFADCVYDMHFMLQKEVVLRLAAGPGSKAYGRLSVMTQYYCQVVPVLEVGPGAFKPAPKVDSAVVRLVPKPRDKVEVADHRSFANVVRAAFGQRRKTLRNALNGVAEGAQIEAAGLRPDARAEQVEVAGFVRLANLLATG